MTGEELTVGYFDQNEAFKHVLPRSGRIVREVSLEDCGSGWYLLALDNPFEYQHKLAEPYVFKAMSISHLLIKSRWEGVEICDGQPTSVFVLLVPDLAVFEDGNVSSTVLIPACWGMVDATNFNDGTR